MPVPVSPPKAPLGNRARRQDLNSPPFRRVLLDPTDPEKVKAVYSERWDGLKAQIEQKTSKPFTWADWLRRSGLEVTRGTQEWFRRLRSGERLGQRDELGALRRVALLIPLKEFGIIDSEEDEFGWYFSWLSPQKAWTTQDAEKTRSVMNNEIEIPLRKREQQRKELVNAAAKNDRHIIRRRKKSLGMRP